MLLSISVFSVTDIRTKGKNASNKYNVPDEHSFSQDIILEQLDIMDSLFPAAKARIRTDDAAEKRHSSVDEKTCPSAKRQKIETEASGRDTNAESKVCSTSSSSSDKNGIVQKTTQQPMSRLELKESIKRAFEQTKISDVRPTNDVPSTAPSQFTTDASKPAASSSKITRDIHQYIAVVNPKGQMQKKLDQAAPYNFFLTTITDCKQTHREPLSITFQGGSANFGND